MKELLRDRGLVLGRFDSRYTGVDPDDNAGEYPSEDPSGYGVDGAFVATMNDYLARDLDVKMDRDYTIVNRMANRKWKRAGGSSSMFGGFLNVLPYLSQGMTTNKDLRVFVASGQFDLATAFFASEYMVSHGGLVQDRVTMKHYGAGHMMYVHQPSFEQLAKDLRAFVESK
jgi:carboxypeptidase C (cathepsin A)